MNKDGIHTTNYFNTFIEVAEDTQVSSGTKPLAKGGKQTVAMRQYELLVNNPYQFTSDDIFFLVFAEKNHLTQEALAAARKDFFSKGQPCFRASPLTKIYGFGVHADNEGKVALWGMETEKYQQLANDPTIQKVKAMRTSKKSK
ncbi:MAG TPA: hypothetical protein DCM08_03475 [Microscillaceae bacterium]|jgi:hypothetical protein|nr:hypothetical protein [Microscillaceae bacterium]